MIVSIVAPDSVVVVDGIARRIDLTGLDPAIHAIQWDGRTGEIEFRQRGVPHTAFDDLAPYQVLLDRWAAADPALIPPAPPPTKDEQIDRIFADPVLKEILLLLAANKGMATELQLRAAVKLRLP